MQGNTPIRNVKALEAALANAKALVSSIEAAIAGAAIDPTEPLNAKQTMAEFGIGRDGLLAAAHRGEIELTRGPRDQIRVERQQVERLHRGRPHRPRPRATPANDLADLTEWDADAERELRAMGGAE